MSSPIVRRIELGRELRRLRERARASYEDAATRLESQTGKISKIENGRSAPPAAEVRSLCELYGASEEETESVLAIAREARKRTNYRVPDWARTYVGLEAEAAEIKFYQAELIPGLLQTEAYTRAVTRANDPTRSPDEIERMVATRRERQSRLGGDDPPQLWVVMNEGVIRRAGSPTEVMVEQLDRLLELGQLPRVSIQVLPFAAGPHAAMGTSFAILRLAEPREAEMVYLEEPVSADYVEREQHVRTYASIFDRVAAMAANAEESARIIGQQRKELT